MNTSDRIAREMEESAIHPALAAANVIQLNGDEISELLIGATSEALGKHALQYFTKPLARYEKLYAPLNRSGGGGWAVYSHDLSGREYGSPLVKPFSPRVDFESKKRVKYETASKCPGTPIVSVVPDEVAQATWDRWGVRPQGSESYWETVLRGNIPVTLTEGWKKSGALITAGYPAIALRGVTMWHPKGETDKLYPEIEQFCTPDRQFFIAFDQDKKEKTRRNVQQQAVSLGWCLKKHYHAHVRFLRWDGELGKGIDDFIFDQGAEALAVVYDHAIGLLQATYGTPEEKAQRQINAALDLKILPERCTAGEYMPELPPLQFGSIHLLDAGMGSGKTVRMGADWVKTSPCFTLLLTPMNALGRQTAQRWELPHIHDMRGVGSDLIWPLAKQEGGIAMCADSLHKLPDWIWDMPVLLIFDEVNQTLDNLCSAGTTGDRQGAILKILGQLCRHALGYGAIIAAEDGILRHSVEFLLKVGGVGRDRVRLFRHSRQQAPWDCTIHAGNISQISGFRGQILERVRRGERVMFVTSSQKEGLSLEHAVLQQCPDAVVARIDSETNEGAALQPFFMDPDLWVEEQQPNLLIISPSAKSGVSIELPYFDSVWGYFPALDAITHWQLLGRYRQPVPRHIFTPEFIMATSIEQMGTARKIRQHVDNYSNHLSNHLSVAAAEADEDSLDATLQEAMLDFYSWQMSLLGAQKKAARRNLTERLERAGHQVKEAPLAHDAAIADLWREIRSGLELQEAQELASAVIDEKKHHILWANRLLSSKESSRTDRAIARKVLLRLEFPGIAFDDPDETYQAVTRDNGALCNGAKNYARMLNIAATREIDRDRAQKIMSQGIKSLQRMPKNYVACQLLLSLGLPQLIERLEAAGQYNAETEEIEEFRRKAIQNAEKIRVFLGLNVDEEQGGVEVFHKIIKKHLGLRKRTKMKDGLIDSFKVGPRGAQVKYYVLQTKQSEVYQKLLKAFQERLKQRMHDLLNREESNSIKETENTAQTGVGAAVVIDGDRFLIRQSSPTHLLLAPEDQPDMPLDECLPWAI